jgi:hypothetical protein
MANNREDLELEPPTKAEIRKIVELDDNIEDYDHPLDVVTAVIKQRSATLQAKEKNQGTEQSEYEEMSVSEHQERLKSTFSHDGSGSSNNEDLSEDDRSVKDIQSELADRVFSHD